MMATGFSGSRSGPIVIVPEVKDGQSVGITLLHVRFAAHLPEGTARGVLQGYRNRYAVLPELRYEYVPFIREGNAVRVRREGPLTGGGVTLLALHNPVYLAHRIAMLDHMARGRFQWGIGGGAIICPGVRIGAGSVIGAGSIVTREIPEGVFAAGNPCRVVREVRE